MEIMGSRNFIELPGDKSHELPPLLVHGFPEGKPADRILELANEIVEDEDLLPDGPMEELLQDSSLARRKMDLAINLAEQYFGLLAHWNWGDSILEWIRQCEMTFGRRLELRNLLRNDVWPHAGRSSFVTLLTDKAVKTPGVELHKAVGLRLTFRQPPPISFFSNQFLFYLNRTVASTAYQTWADMTPEPISALPPERFHFKVVNM